MKKQALPFSVQPKGTEGNKYIMRELIQKVKRMSVNKTAAGPGERAELLEPRRREKKILF